MQGSGPESDQHIAVGERRLETLAEKARVRGGARRERADADRIGCVGLDPLDDFARE